MSKEEKELKDGQKRYFQKYINEFKELSQEALLEIEDLKREFIEGSDSSYSMEELEGFKNQLIGLHGFMVTQNNNGKTIEEQLISFKENAEKESKEILNLKNQISNYKVEFHKEFLKKWLTENPEIEFDIEKLWKVREKCIEDLSN